MKHTIICCDLCNGRIYKDGWLFNKGAVTFRLKELKVDDDYLPIVYPGWKRRKIHICPKCVEKIKKICKGENPNENA